MSKYIKKLSNEEIEIFFNNNGYKLAKDITDDNDLPIDSIERDDDSIFVRTQQMNDNEIDLHLNSISSKKYAGILALTTLFSMHAPYSRDIHLFHITDYFLSKFCIFPEDSEIGKTLLTSYFKFMIDKFPTYKKDLEEYVESLPDDESESENTI
ncbi:MAG: hypothetical protein E7379_03230 [Clostridiales bacterium]|nr:hypothetical protein [Clostridiales bacterium]